jgi:hypothetical protein
LASTLQTPIEEQGPAVDLLPAISLTHLDLAAPPAETSGGTLAVPSREAPWKVAAEAGLAISAGSRLAAVKTAAAFTRFGKSFANPK